MTLKVLREKYKKLSDELPQEKRKEWLKNKEKLLTQNLQPKDWIGRLEIFHEEIIQAQLDKWASWRQGEMKCWGLKPQQGISLYDHYKNQIKGFKDAVTLIEKINCIKNQTMQDMDIVFSYEDWERDR